MNVQNMDSIPYTTAMIPITNDTFIMEGMFADVFNSLRVYLDIRHNSKQFKPILYVYRTLLILHTHSKSHLIKTGEPSRMMVVGMAWSSNFK